MKEIRKEKGSVYCNEGAWQAFENELLSLQPSSIFVLTDSNTKKHCLPVFLNVLNHTLEHTLLEMPTGEVHKTIASCANLWEELSEKGADRASLLINLGGGVVTDLGGFVASTFKRGISFINIPTSLLAMVDASVGGKNGVDLGVLKNQIGVINNPNAVIVDTQFLATLPPEEVTSGYAEMLKHGLIHSEAYWKELQHFSVENTSEAANLIWESIQIKNEVVTKDPLEQNLRKMLNYGHTLGHAIESYFLETAGKMPLLHGEAVAIGMILATYISTQQLHFPKEKLTAISAVILSHFSKQSFSPEDIQAIIKLLIYDKKNSHGKVYFVLLEDIGKHSINQEVPNTLIHTSFDYYKNL